MHFFTSHWWYHQHRNSVTNIHKLSPTSCHQHQDFTNITVIFGSRSRLASVARIRNRHKQFFVTNLCHGSFPWLKTWVSSVFPFFASYYKASIMMLIIFGDTLRSWNTSLWLRNGGCWWRKSPNLASISPNGHLKNKKNNTKGCFYAIID